MNFERLDYLKEKKKRQRYILVPDCIYIYFLQVFQFQVVEWIFGVYQISSIKVARA